MTDLILTVNAGSSSIKFALFRAGSRPEEQLRGQVEGLGATPRLTADSAGETLADRDLAPEEAEDHRAALGTILDLLDDRADAGQVAAVGHRIVHGGTDYAAPVRIDDAVYDTLEGLCPLAPLHQPHNLAGVAAARDAFPEAVQVACFDTAFHRAHPWVADTYALPRRYYDEGIRRYGFHGLSYAYVSGQLRREAPEAAAGRVVITHLGNGASMCALRDGSSVASSMGFTALDGLPMGTRCGQLDPGVVLYLMGQKGMSAGEIEHLLYRESGLRGLSGLSHDMRQLEESGTEEAEEAIAYFVHRIRREIGAMTAVLGGLDTLVFCGGIGENSSRIRAAVCEGFGWLGLSLEPGGNAAGEGVISAPGSRVEVRVIPTDEEAMIASDALEVLRGRA